MECLDRSERGLGRGGEGGRGEQIVYIALQTILVHTSGSGKRSPPSRSVGSYPNVIGCVFPQIGQDVAGGVARYVNRVEGVG